MKISKAKVALLGLYASAALFVISPVAFSQINSNTASVSLTATLAESLTISATPNAVSFSLVSGGVAVANFPVVITTTWVLGSGRANVVLDGYFSSSTGALTFAGPPASSIPTSSVLGQMTTGSPTVFTAFTQTSVFGGAGAGLTLFTQALTTTNRAATRTDSLSLEIDLTALPQLPAGSYTGTLTLQAQAL
jgi:hypothetical protein